MKKIVLLLVGVLISCLSFGQTKIWSSDFSNAADWDITSNGPSGLNWVFTKIKPSSLNANNGWVKSFTAFNSVTYANNFIALDATNACSGSRKAIITSATSFSTLNKSNLVIKFSQLYAKSPSDVATVEISTDNKLNWKQYTFNNKYASNTGSTNPENVVIDISADAAGKSSVWVRFVFTGTTGASATDYGWFIDDFSVEEIPTVDALGWFGFFKSKTSSCGLVSDSIGVYVINKGLTPLTSTTTMNYKINNNSTVTENSKFLDIHTLQPKTSLVKGDTAIHFFSSKIDMSIPGTTYNILAFVNAPSDVVSSNDSVKFSIINYSSLAVTNLVSYNEDFENQTLNGFTTEDVDKKGLKFGLAASGNLAVTTSTPSSNLSCLRIFENNVKGTSDDWAFSRCLDLDPNYTYTLSYYSRSSSTSPQTYAGKLSVSIGNSASSTAMTQPIVTAKILTPDAKYYKNTSTFIVDKAGTYYLGFRGYNTSADSTIAIRIDDISLSAKGKNADILTFSLKAPSVTGVINGKNITLDVASNTNVSALIANFTTSPGAIVKVLNNTQNSGTSINDFKNSVTYVVTSEDGSTTNNYSVTVKVAASAKSSLKEFLTFQYSTNPVSIGVIDSVKNTISINVPSGTDVSKLAPIFTTSNVSKVTAGTLIGSTSPYTMDYTVTAEDGSFKKYIATITVAASPKSSACELTSFGILTPLKGGIINGTDVSVTLPSGTLINSLIATFSVSDKATVKVNSLLQQSGVNSQDFTQPVSYIVTAEDGTTKMYKVTVSVLPTTNLKIWSSDFTNTSDWTLNTGDLVWQIVTKIPDTTVSKDLHLYWLDETKGSEITSFNSTSKGNFALLDASHVSTKTGRREGIMTVASPINTSNNNKVILKFNQLYRSYKDSTYVEVSSDNVNWSTFKCNKNYLFNQQSSNPEYVSIDISSKAAKQNALYLRFRFNGIAATNDFDYAWMIDDVSLEDVPLNDLAVIGGVIKNQTQQIQSCLGNEQLGIYVVNRGISPVSAGTPISFSVNNGKISTESAVWLDIKTKQTKSTLVYGDTALCLLTNTADLSLEKSYTIKLFTTLSGDVFVNNDTTTLKIDNLAVKSITNINSYTQNFENQTFNGFTFEDVDKGGFGFDMATVGNTSITTNTNANSLSCIRLIDYRKGSTDDWTFSPCLNLKPGFLYSFTYYTRLGKTVPGANNTTVPCAAQVETKLGKSPNSSGMSQTLTSIKQLTADGIYAKTTATFTVNEDAIYYLGFHGQNLDTSKAISLRFDDISLTAKSTQCDITSFDIVTPAATGTISGTNIAITVPFGTDVKALISNFVTSNGATVKVGTTVQISGQTKNDFTLSQSFVVTAEDGVTSKTYIVNVKVSSGNQQSSANDLLTFSFASLSMSGTYSGNNISFTVPNGTTVSSLVATFTSSPLSNVKVKGVLQQSGVTPQDFTNPVIYVVTAEDGTIKSYTVTVTFSSGNTNSSADIISFGLANPSVIGVISGKNITVTVPAGTYVKSLVPTFVVSTGASVKVSSISQVSNGSVVDFSAPVTYVVTSQDGKTINNYVVNVIQTPLLSSDKELISFSFPSLSVSGTISGNTVGLTVPFGTNVSALAASFTTSPNSTVRIGSTVQVSGSSVNNFVISILYTIVAQDGSIKNYTVVVTPSAQTGGGNGAGTITSFALGSPMIPGIISGTTITIEGQAGSDITKQLIVFGIPIGSTLTLNGIVQTSGVSIVDFSNNQTFTLVGADGSKKDYIVKVTIPKKTGNSFTTFGFLETPTAVTTIDTTNKLITVHVPYNAPITKLTAYYLVSPGAVVTYGGQQLLSASTYLSFINDQTFVVVAENTNKTAAYKIHVIVDAQTTGIEEVSISNVEIYPNPSKGEFTCHASIDSYELKVLDVLGNEVYFSLIESNGTEKHVFDISEFGSGIYFASIQVNGISTIVKLEVVK